MTYGVTAKGKRLHIMYPYNGGARCRGFKYRDRVVRLVTRRRRGDPWQVCGTCARSWNAFVEWQRAERKAERAARRKGAA